jgi:hypothetical protein
MRKIYNYSTPNACTDDLYTKTSSVVEYYERFVLGNQDSSWDNFGYPRWQSVLALGMIICLSEKKDAMSSLFFGFLNKEDDKRHIGQGLK